MQNHIKSSQRQDKMKLLLLATFAVFCAASTLYRNKNISVNEDGSILITSPSGKRVVITRPNGLNGQRSVDISVSGPNIPTRRIQINDNDSDYQGSGRYQWSSLDSVDDELRLKRGTKKVRSQGDVLYDILREYQGVVDETLYEKLLNRINKSVTKGEISRQIYDLLVALDQIDDTSVLNEVGVQGVILGQGGLDYGVQQGGILGQGGLGYGVQQGGILGQGGLGYGVQQGGILGQGGLGYGVQQGGILGQGGLGYGVQQGGILGQGGLGYGVQQSGILGQLGIGYGVQQGGILGQRGLGVEQNRILGQGDLGVLQGRILGQGNLGVQQGSILGQEGLGLGLGVQQSGILSQGGVEQGSILGQRGLGYGYRSTIRPGVSSLPWWYPRVQVQSPSVQLGGQQIPVIGGGIGVYGNSLYRLGGRQYLPISSYVNPLLQKTLSSGQTSYVDDLLIRQQLKDQVEDVLENTLNNEIVYNNVPVGTSQRGILGRDEALIKEYLLGSQIPYTQRQTLGGLSGVLVNNPLYYNQQQPLYRVGVKEGYGVRQPIILQNLDSVRIPQVVY